METLVILGILGAAGYYLKDKSNRLEGLSLLEKEPEIKSENSNIYTSNMVESANNEILGLSLKNYKDSKYPEKSGILPPMYNSFSVGDDYTINGKDAFNFSTFKELSDINNINKLSNVSGSNVQQNINTLPMFNPSNVGTNINQDPFSNYGNNSNGKDISLLTGMPIEKEHNNLVPFFGGSIRQNVETFTNESKLDNYTGNTSTFFHKQEQPQFFDNVAEMGVIGNTKTPLLTDNIELDRFIPSVYRQNEKPFYEERVAAPISGTINDPVTKAGGEFKSIDELRAGNKPQISYSARNNSGQFGSVRGIQGHVAKNRADTFYEHTQDKLFTSVGAYTGNMSNLNYQNLQETARQNQNLEYYGAAGDTGKSQRQRISSMDNTSEFNALFQVPMRQQLSTDTTRNIKTNLNPDGDNYNVNSYSLPELERNSLASQPLSNVNNSLSGHQIGIQDQVKSTLKQSLLSGDNSGNIRSVQINSSNTEGLGTDYSFKTTQKESLVKSKYKGQISKNDSMGYDIANYDAKTTQKESTLNKNYLAQFNDSNKNPMGRDAFNDPQKIRNAIEIKDYRGNVETLYKDPQDRTQYLNADISEIKEDSLTRDHFSGKNGEYGNISAGLGALGDIQLTDNLLLKEQQNYHTQNISNISNNIPSVSLIGDNTQQFYGQDSQVDQFSINTNDKNNRFNADLISQQLNNNPFYNLNKQ
jgi:hypothetical protein